MASIAYLAGLEKVKQEGSNNLTFKILLIQAVGSSPNNPDDPTRATVAAILNGTIATEFNDTGYTPGPGSTSRRTLTNVDFVQDGANTRLEFDFDDPATWTALGGTQSVVAALVYIHTSDADDTLNIPYTYHDIADTQTNGQDFTLQVGSEGAMHITV